jgi:ankyrin repeat protein
MKNLSTLPKVGPLAFLHSKKSSPGRWLGAIAVVLAIVSGVYQFVCYLGCADSDNHDLYAAIEGRDLSDLQRLLSEGHDPNSTQQCYVIDIDGYRLVTDPQPDPPLFYAVEHGSPEIVAALLEKGANPNQVGSNGYVPLFDAILHADYDSVAVLLKNHADPNWKNSKTGETPLIQAVKLNQVKNVQALLIAGAEPNTRDATGNTAFVYADTDGEARALLKKYGGHE